MSLRDVRDANGHMKVWNFMLVSLIYALLAAAGLHCFEC